MRYNPRLKSEILSYLNFPIIVEGKKDVQALQSMGFTRLYAIHETGVSIRERIEQIASTLDKKDKLCILTDFDKKGRALYMLIKKICQELGVKLDSSLRGLLIKARVSHIEGLDSFMEKIDKIN